LFNLKKGEIMKTKITILITVALIMLTGYGFSQVLWAPASGL
jgi:hypothetical protein